MKKYLHKFAWIIGIVVILSIVTFSMVKGDTQDHSSFGLLEGPFETGPDVTSACITCHSDVPDGIMESVHWTWEETNPVTGDNVGKNDVINNYCVSVASNEPRCTSCHIGYGYKDSTFDFEDETLIDCLVCHDTTGTYKKFPTGAGHPVYDEPKLFNGVTWEPPASCVTYSRRPYISYS